MRILIWIRILKKSLKNEIRWKWREKRREREGKKNFIDYEKEGRVGDGERGEIWRRNVNILYFLNPKTIFFSFFSPLLLERKLNF